MTQKPICYVERQGNGVWIVPRGAKFLYGSNLHECTKEQPSDPRTTYLIPVPAEERWVLLNAGETIQPGDCCKSESGNLEEILPYWCGHRVHSSNTCFRRITFPDVAALLKERDEAREELEQLRQSGVFPTCSGCKKVFRDGNLAQRWREAYAHIEKCEHHPITKANKEIVSLQSQLKTVTKERNEWRHCFDLKAKELGASERLASQFSTEMQAKLAAAEEDCQNKLDLQWQAAKAVEAERDTAEARVRELEEKLSTTEASLAIADQAHTSDMRRADAKLSTLRAEHDALINSLRWIPVSERMPTEEDGDQGFDVLWWVGAGCLMKPWNKPPEDAIAWMRCPSGPEPTKTESERIAEEWFKVNPGFEFSHVVAENIVEFAVNWKKEGR